MKKFQCYIVLTFFVLLGYSSKANEIDFKKLSFEQAMALSKETSKPIFIDFYTQWCGPCKKMSSEVFTDQELSKIIDSEYIAIQLDAEAMGNLDAVKQFNINAYPTIVFVNPKIDYSKKLIGFQSIENLINESSGFTNPMSQLLYQLQKRYESGDREANFILNYIQELKINKLDYRKIARAFVSEEAFSFDSAAQSQIFLLADLDIEHPKMKLFLSEMNEVSDLHQEIFMQIAIRVYDSAFRSRNKLELNKFVNSYHSMFESITEVKMDSHDIINYLSSHHRFKI